MIPTIGFMIGCYIIARSIEMFFKDYKGNVARIVMGVIAVILIIVTVMSIFDLFSASQSSTRSLSNIPSF